MISQTAYLKKVLQNYLFEKTINPVLTPIQPGVYLLKAVEKADPRAQKLFAAMIGALLYMAICTRLNLSYVVQNFSQFTSAPNQEHWAALKRLLHYITGTLNTALIYAYRGIALLNTMSKVLLACIAKELTYWTETLNILPNGHFGGRPGCNTTNALHALTAYIKNTWQKRQVVTALFLNVKGAFPSIVVSKLLHNMRMKGVPKIYTDWIQQKLSHRKTTINFDDFQSKPFQIHSGVDQGCPLSILLYQYYNATLVKLTNPANTKYLGGYIDNIVLAATGKTFAKSNTKVTQMITRQGGANEWATTHESQFAPKKIANIGFTRQQIPHPTIPHKTMPML